MPPAIDIDREALAKLCEQHGIARMALFGSVVSGDFGETSDVDIALEFAPEAEVGLIEFSRIRRKLSRLLGRKVDLHTFNEMNDRARRAVEQQAEDIYAA